MKNPIKIFILLLTTSASFGCGTLPHPPENLKKVETATATLSNVPKQITVTGTLQGINETDLSARAMGIVTRIDADLGDRIVSGEPLATLELSTETAMARSLSHNSNAARQTLDSLAALYDERIRGAERNLELSRQGSRAALALLGKQIEEAQGKILPSTEKVSGATVDMLETQISTAKRDLETKSLTVLASVESFASQATDKFYEVHLPENPNRYSYDTPIFRYFKNLTSNTKFQTETAISDFYNAQKAFRDSYQANVSRPGVEAGATLETLGKANALLDHSKMAFFLLQETLSHSVATNEFTPEQLMSYKSGIVALKGQNDALSQQVSDLYGQDGLSGQIAVLEKQAAQAEAQAQFGTVSVESQIAILNEQMAKARIDTRSQIEQAESGLETLRREKEAKLSEARGSLAQISGQAMVTQAMISNGTVTAPFSGTVTEKYIDLGSFVAPGTPLFHLADDRVIKLKVGLPDSLSSDIRVGQTAHVRIDELGDTDFTATVAKVSTGADSASRKIAVEMTLDNPERTLKVGSFAHVTFSIPRQNRVTIPPSAILSRYGSNFVFVVEGKTVSQRRITPGESTDSEIEILDSLKLGETVVTKGNSHLKDGDTVTLNPAP